MKNLKKEYCFDKNTKVANPKPQKSSYQKSVSSVPSALSAKSVLKKFVLIDVIHGFIAAKPHLNLNFFRDLGFRIWDGAARTFNFTLTLTLTLTVLGS